MRVFVINGHPDNSSFCHALADSYRCGCEEAGVTCRIVNLSDVKFNPVLKYGYNIKMELEPDLALLQELIMDASHLVFVFPIWWGTYPALLKGFIDRAFLPGYAFKYKSGSQPPERLLKGKTATIITTMDTPGWYYRLIYHRPAYFLMKRSLLSFCGIFRVRYISFAPMKKSTALRREKWIRSAFELGTKIK